MTNPLSPQPSSTLSIWRDPFFIRNLVYGIEDSLISTTGVVVGITVAGLPYAHIIIAALILILVEATSMAYGAFMSEESFLITAKAAYNLWQIGGYALTMFLSYLATGLIILLPYFAKMNKAYIYSIVIATLCLFVLVLATQRNLHRATVMTCIGLVILILTIYIGSIMDKKRKEFEAKQ